MKKLLILSFKIVPVLIFLTIFYSHDTHSSNNSDVNWYQLFLTTDEFIDEKEIESIKSLKINDTTALKKFRGIKSEILHTIKRENMKTLWMLQAECIIEQYKNGGDKRVDAIILLSKATELNLQIPQPLLYDLEDIKNEKKIFHHENL